MLTQRPTQTPTPTPRPFQVSPVPLYAPANPTPTPEPLAGARRPEVSDEVYTEEEIQAMLAFGLTPSEYLIRAQARLNADRERAAEAARVSALTYESAMADAHEALTGVAADLTGATERTSLKDILTYGNRLRGLGVLCIGVAMVGLLVDYIAR